LANPPKNDTARESHTVVISSNFLIVWKSLAPYEEDIVGRRTWPRIVGAYIRIVVIDMADK